MKPLKPALYVLLGVALGWATSSVCARAQVPHAEAVTAETTPNDADAVECYWSVRHGLCLCSGNWRDRNPSLVMTRASGPLGCR